LTAPTRSDRTHSGGVGRRVLRHLKVRVGLAVSVLLLIGAAAHPLLQATIWDGQESIYGPETGHDRGLEHPTGPSVAHPLGTDALGRDVLSILAFSLAPALQVTVLAALLVGLLSIAVGSLAAYFRGWVDLAVTSIGDAVTLLPPTIALLVVGVGKPAFGTIDAGLLLGLLYGLGPAALVVRSRALQVIEKPFLDAARIAGSGPGRIIRTQMLPHLLPYAGIQMMGAGIGALTSVAFIQYLGATDQSRVGLGSMIYTAIDVQPVLPTGAGYGSFNMGDFHARIGWTSLLSAGLAMTLIAAAFYLIAVGSRDAVIPNGRR
jgi:peptide/nickel transport system permease protein